MNNIVCVIICDLINVVIFHGYTPGLWLTGTIIPLLKSANVDKSSTASYRLRTFSILFGKLVDMLILNRYYEACSTSDMRVVSNRLILLRTIHM